MFTAIEKGIIMNKEQTTRYFEQLCECLERECPVPPKTLKALLIEVRQMEKKLKKMGFSKWRCEICGETVMADEDTLREVGNPFCTDCEREMNPV